MQANIFFFNPPPGRVLVLCSTSNLNGQPKKIAKVCVIRLGNRLTTRNGLLAGVVCEPEEGDMLHQRHNGHVVCGSRHGHAVTVRKPTGDLPPCRNQPRRRWPSVFRGASSSLVESDWNDT